MRSDGCRWRVEGEEHESAARQTLWTYAVLAHSAIVRCLEFCRWDDNPPPSPFSSVFFIKKIKLTAPPPTSHTRAYSWYLHRRSPLHLTPSACACARNLQQPSPLPRVQFKTQACPLTSSPSGDTLVARRVGWAVVRGDNGMRMQMKVLWAGARLDTAVNAESAAESNVSILSAARYRRKGAALVYALQTRITHPYFSSNTTYVSPEEHVLTASCGTYPLDGIRGWDGVGLDARLGFSVDH
ncbi:hypothetical protein C8J57DRAFT_1502639 [Mycena rebaudengoi]|nr:hypothetical protein C8J57DRAFT_1502639 [Mycena rebaudengoi]